jgi:hypothetical protein
MTGRSACDEARPGVDELRRLATEWPGAVAFSKPSASLHWAFSQDQTAATNAGVAAARAKAQRDSSAASSGLANK